MKVSFNELCELIEWNPNFWNPTKLLTRQDTTGGTPGVYVAISNRTGGKTYGIGQILMLYATKYSGKFGLICQNQNELGSIAAGVLGAVLRDLYPYYQISEDIAPCKKYSLIIVRDLRIDDPDEVKDFCIGYVFPISGATKLKNYSSKFVDCDILFMDEFQSEKYLKNEVNLFVRLRTSIARGDGQGVRYVPVIMCSNSISIENPYFVAMHINNKLQSNTRFYRGNGVVLERFTNLIVADAQRQDPFNRAFSDSAENRSAIGNEWLNDNYACVSKPSKDWGTSSYMCSLIDGEKNYGVRKYSNGYWYFNRTIDSTCPNVYAIRVDGIENAPIIQNFLFFKAIRDAYYRGQVRFSDLAVKNVMTEIVL